MDSQAIKVSIIVPIYNMDHAQMFLKRNLESILMQTFKDYEIIVSDDSTDDMLKIWLKKYPIKYYRNSGVPGMANNTNNAIEYAHGELIKILYQDDFFYNENSLQDIVDAFTKKTDWLVTGCTHTDGRPHLPFYSRTMNTIGSPSVLTIRNGNPLRFDPQFKWVLDLDFYRRCFERYGLPKVLPKTNVVIGIGEHQSTFLLSDKRKQIEEAMML